MLRDLTTSLAHSPSGAALSNDGVYRYLLWRRWKAGNLLGFVMLNPSTADGLENDPTIRRCIGFANRLDFGGILVANRFAFRATDPRNLPRDPAISVGPHNAAALDFVFDQCPIVIAAWGAHPSVLRLPADNRQYWCLGRTASGAPRHPLYLRNDAPLDCLS